MKKPIQTNSSEVLATPSMAAEREQLEKFNQLQGGFATGRISRRNFISGALALGVSLSAASALVGCSESSRPKKGSTLRYGTWAGSTSDSLDPGTYSSDFMIGSSFVRYNFLTEIAPNGELIGELAESWDVTPDVKQWTFKLRRGVEFQNGKTMTAQDVITSLNHHRGEGATSAMKEDLSTIESIRADGEHTVVVTLKEGNADFPVLMSDYHLPIMQDKDGKADWQSSIGTGPYQSTEIEMGVRANYKRNPNYWKEGRAHFDAINILVIADVSARTNALTTGEVDMIDRVETKTAHLLKRNRNVLVEETSGNGHYSIPMRTNLKPFDDNNIRLALKYGVDRDAILETILHGYGYVGNDHPIGRGQRYFNDDLPQKELDIDKAKFYLRKAGVSTLRVDLKASDGAFAGGVDAATLYKEHAAPAGIEINVVREPADGYWSNVWNTDNCGWCECYWGGRPTEDLMFSVAYAADAAWNDTSWKHTRFNQLLREARVELDEKKRGELYHEMQRIVSDEGGVVIPVFNSFVHAISKKVSHEEEMATNWANDGHRYCERWWFS